VVDDIPNPNPDISTTADRRERLRNLQQSRRDLEPSQARQSLEGLRLGALLRQLEALQAVQGLEELKPTQDGDRRRLKIADDPGERARQRQWLRFKADWLEALLDSTLRDLEAMDAFESTGQNGAGGTDAGPSEESS
jgi:hypothetical protein